jgi:hypothetical protein
MSRAPLFVLMIAVACSKRAPVPSETAKAASATETMALSPAVPPSSLAAPTSGGSPMATMKLLDAGRGPRHKLRYSWRAGRAERATVDLRTATSTEILGEKPTEIPLPPVHIVIALDPQSVTADGTLLYAWQVLSASVAESRETPSQIADGMRLEVSAIDHLSGKAEVTSRGLARDVSIDSASVNDAGATGQMIEQVRQILRDLAAPFPEEEIGQGARWEKLSQLASKDARITQTDTFSLLELTGNKGIVDDVLAQTAPPQALTASGPASGAQARLESMLASGDAKTHFDLSRLAPETKFDGTTTMVVSSQAPSEGARHLTMIMRIEIVLAGSLP